MLDLQIIQIPEEDMAKTVYYIKVRMADGEEEYKQITGKDFYSLVSTEEGKKRCFVKLPGDENADVPTVVIETTKEQYREWRREYDAERYKNHNQQYSEVSYERIYEELEETVGGTDPQGFVIGMEIADRIREVYRDLDEKDKQIFSKRFIKNPRMTKNQIAKELGMTRSSVSRRVKKIQEMILRRL